MSVKEPHVLSDSIIVSQVVSHRLGQVEDERPADDVAAAPAPAGPTPTPAEAAVEVAPPAG